jgi:sorbitol-specific phosphotransferase system component IIBC
VGRIWALVAESIRTALADHLLQMLLLGVIAAAFLLVSLGADISTVIGVLGIGCATAFMESANHRSRKR